MVIQAKLRGKKKRMDKYPCSLNGSRKAQNILMQLKQVTGYTIGELLDMAVFEFEKKLHIKTPKASERRTWRN